MSKEVSRVIADSDELMPTMQWAWDMAGRGLAAGPVRFTLGRPTQKRSNDQNRLMWALLNDLSQQVQWHGLTLTPEEWKDLATAALKKHRIVPGMDGGFVMVGGHTSRMNKREFSGLLETIYSFGSEQGVAWSDDATQQWADYKEAA